MSLVSATRPPCLPVPWAGFADFDDAALVTALRLRAESSLPLLYRCAVSSTRYSLDAS